MMVSSHLVYITRVEAYYSRQWCVDVSRCFMYTVNSVTSIFVTDRNLEFSMI